MPSYTLRPNSDVFQSGTFTLVGASNNAALSDSNFATYMQSLGTTERTVIVGLVAGLEVPFSLAIAGRLIRGRIDAVFPAGPDAPPGQLWEVVDWKTSQHDLADPLQLAIYRLAWADLAGVPVAAVGAAFAFIRSGTVLRPAELLGAEELAALLAGEDEEVVDLGE
jgi:hypothetical protein